MVLEHGKSVFEGDTEAAIDFYLNNSTLDTQKQIDEIEEREGLGQIKFSNILIVLQIF